MLIRRRPAHPATPGASESVRTGHPSGPDAVLVRTPAKVNLFLELLGKRPDGYHELATVMAATDLCDDLEFVAAESGSLSLTCDRPELSAGPDNLVLRAANLLRERTGTAKGAAVHLTKRVPWAAGLGGGSGNAAGTLAGLNELWGLGLAHAELSALAAEIGSDVPFFLDGPAAWCTGRGEIVQPLPVGRPFDLVLACPPVGLSTAEVYKRAKVPERPLDGTEVRAAVAAGDVNALAKNLFNRLQEPAMQICPPVEDLYRRLRSTGAAGCLMSGSGSSLFALCRDRPEAERVAECLRGGSAPGSAPTRVWLVRSCLSGLPQD